VAALNDRGTRTPRGIGEWKAGTVAQLLARMPGGRCGTVERHVVDDSADDGAAASPESPRRPD
jgi:hypothetical protein